MIEKQKEDHTVAGPQFGPVIIVMAASETSCLPIPDALKSRPECLGPTYIYVGTCLVFGIWHPVLA